MRYNRALIPFLAFALLGNTPLVYLLDAKASEVRAKVAFFAIASKTATFPSMEGAVTIVPDKPSQALIEVTLDATRLIAPDKVTLRRLKSEKFFWVEKYPTVRFLGRNLIMRDATHGEVDGELTARGVTRPERLYVTFDRSPTAAPPGESITLSGEMEINRRDYGMNSYGFIVGKKVKIRLKARMVPQVPA